MAAAPALTKLEGAAAVLGVGVKVADPLLPVGFEEEELPGL